MFLYNYLLLFVLLPSSISLHAMGKLLTTFGRRAPIILAGGILIQHEQIKPTKTMRSIPFKELAAFSQMTTLQEDENIEKTTPLIALAKNCTTHSPDHIMTKFNALIDDGVDIDTQHPKYICAWEEAHKNSKATYDSCSILAYKIEELRLKRLIAFEKAQNAEDVDTVIKTGLNPSRRIFIGNIPIDEYIYPQLRHLEGLTPLAVAMHANRNQCIARQLIKHQADPNEHSKKNHSDLGTPLHILADNCAAHNELALKEKFKVLMEAGADLSATRQNPSSIHCSKQTAREIASNNKTNNPFKKCSCRILIRKIDLIHSDQSQNSTVGH